MGTLLKPVWGIADFFNLYWFSRPVLTSAFLPLGRANRVSGEYRVAVRNSLRDT